MLEWDLSALFHDKEALQNFTQDQIQQSLNFKKTMKINFIHWMLMSFYKL